MKNEKAPIPEITQLKEFKKRSGWSYHKISVHMEIHSQTIYFWLKDKYRPSSPALEKIRKFLNVYAY